MAWRVLFAEPQIRGPYMWRQMCRSYVLLRRTIVLLTALACPACVLAAPPSHEIEALQLAIAEFHKALHSVPSHPLRGDSEKVRTAYRSGYLHRWRALIEKVDVSLGNHDIFDPRNLPERHEPPFREKESTEREPRRQFTYRPTLAALEDAARKRTFHPDLEEAYAAGWRDGYSQVLDFFLSAHLELGDERDAPQLTAQPLPNPNHHPTHYRALVLLKRMVPVIDHMNIGEPDAQKHSQRGRESFD